MDAAFVFPWKSNSGPDRNRAKAWTNGYWQIHFPAVPRAIAHGPEPFSRGAALNAAIRKTEAALLIACDTDSVVPAGSLHAALELAGQADGLVVAFDRYRYLTKAQTVELTCSYAPSFHEVVSDDDLEDHGEGGVGNVVVFSRRTWELAGGYDELQGAWGSDDACFAYACEALVGPLRRIPGPMYHLWHPRRPESIPGDRHPLYVESVALAGLYRDAAARGPIAMRALVASRRR